jgi:hypothetical protein
MAEPAFVVQEVRWYQFRTPEGQPFFVLVASLPNGFYTAVPCKLEMTLAAHGNMALAASVDGALEQLQATLAGKSIEEIFAAD